MLTSHSYIILGWNSSNDDLESAVFCPTPEDMKEILPNDLTGYLEYKRTLGCRDLTDAERAAIHTQVEEMADSIELHSGGQRARRTDAEPQPQRGDFPCRTETDKRSGFPVQSAAAGPGRRFIRTPYWSSSRCTAPNAKKKQELILCK